MNIILLICVVFLIDFFIGCLILSILDTDGSLLLWIDDAGKHPATYIFSMLVILLWPIPAFLIVRLKLKSEDK